MELLYEGKTKDVFEIEEKDGIENVGKFAMAFKDSATGYIGPDGEPVFDSGYDTVVGEIPGKGVVDRQATSYFFSLLEKEGIPNHFIKDLDERRIVVEPAILFSLENESKGFEGSARLNNLEVVFRNNYYGSLWRRHPHKRPGSAFTEPLVEIYSKGLPNEPDILMRDDTLVALGVMKPEEIQEVKTITKRVSDILAEEFTKRNLNLLDGKIEVGKRKSDEEIMVIDEISTSVFRACRGFSPDDQGNCTIYKDCIETARKGDRLTILANNLLTADQIAEVFGFRYDPKR